MHILRLFGKLLKSMKSMSENAEQRYKIGKRFFKHAPAFKGRKNKTTGEYLSKRLNRIALPFRGAEPWQCNVYYFWWEFLRRHEGYKDCCERGGKGKYRKLYADFGNIHKHDDFWKWWSEKVEDDVWKTPTRGERLFAEPAGRQIEITNRVFNTRSDTLTVTIPLEIRTPHLIQQLRKLLDERQEQVNEVRRTSRALYPVATSTPKLRALYYALRVYDVEQEHRKRLPNHEKADLAGLEVSDREDIGNGQWVDMAKLRKMGADTTSLEYLIKHRKRTAYKKYLNAAHDYLFFVGLGEFPKRKDKDIDYYEIIQ